MGVSNGSLIKCMASGKLIFLRFTFLISEMGTVRERKMSQSRVHYVGMKTCVQFLRTHVKPAQYGAPGTPKVEKQ